MILQRYENIILIFYNFILFSYDCINNCINISLKKNSNSLKKKKINKFHIISIIYK